MASIKCMVKLSQVGRKASLLAGGSADEVQTIVVDSSNPAFATLLDLAVIEADGAILRQINDLGGYGGPAAPFWDRIPTPAEILTAELERINALALQKIAKAAEQAQREEETRQEALVVLRDRKDQRAVLWDSGSNLCYAGRAADWPYNAPASVKESPEALAWMADLDVQNAASLASAIEEKRLAKEKADAEAVVAAEAGAVRRKSLGLREGDVAYGIEDGALTGAPVWENHKRGKNWMALISVSPSSPGGLARDFCAKARGESFYMMPSLSPGDAVEFGADYYSGSGKKSADRFYGYVVRVDPEGDEKKGLLVLHKCSTGKDACKQGKAFATAAEAAKVDQEDGADA